MDIWSAIWIVFTFLVFPFGYKPILFLFSVSTIFPGSILFTLGDINIPLNFGLEIITIFRLLLPIKGVGVPKFNDFYSIIIILLIPLLFIYTFLITNLFEGMKVYSPNAESFEYNYAVGGLPLYWNKSNINFIVYFSIHMILLLLIYKRRFYLSKKLYLTSILTSIVIFCSFCLIWKIFPDLYKILGVFIFNNDKFFYPALFDDRASGTFIEPSYAGWFIGSLMLPLLFSRNISYKIVGVLLFSTAMLNMSSTLLFAILIAIIFFTFLNKGISKEKIFYSLLSIGVFSAVFLFFQDIISSYIGNKSESVSGVVRSASNTFSINTLLDSYLLGVGVGSVRASSMFISILANFGVIFTFIYFYIICKFICNKKLENTDEGSILKSMLIISFIAAFVSIPEYTFPPLWNLIFANVLVILPNIKRRNNLL